MLHKCTYCDDGYCMKEYGETCPYNDADEQCKCLEYEPKENYIAAEDYKNQIKSLQEKLGKVLSQVNVSKEMTLQEAKRQGAEEFAEMLKEKAGTSFDYFMGFQKIVLAEQIDELLEEYKND